MVYSLKKLCDHLGVPLQGDDAEIIGLATLQNAQPGQLSFLANPKYAHYLEHSLAEAVLLTQSQAEGFSGRAIIVENPYEAFARLTALFASNLRFQPEIHPSAHIHPDSDISDEGVYIGPGVVIEAGVKVAAKCFIGANSFIGTGTTIDIGTRIEPNVTLYHNVSVGEQCLIHSGSVIGADGFGYAPSAEGWLKIHQLGGVRIGNRVEIGANVCIDRGALDDTVLEDGVIIDNQVQIAHNVAIGKNTAIAAQSAVAGSTRIGENCTLAGRVGVVGHLDITDGCHVTATTLITKSITEKGSYSSGTPFLESKQWRKSAVRFGQLDQLTSRVKQCEKLLAQVKNGSVSGDE